MAGIVNKFVIGLDYVTAFYTINMIMVAVDIILYIRNGRLEKAGRDVKK